MESKPIEIKVNKKDKEYSSSTIPKNSISCFIGRICEDPGDSFADDGILWVDFINLDEAPEGWVSHSDNGKGSREKKAIASWSLRAAYIAWNTPPMIKFKGKVKLNGKISMSNAQLSNVTLAGGPPLIGTTVTFPALPGTSTTPFAISAASGTAKIEQQSNAEIEMETGDDLNIELTSQTGAQLPWCVSPQEANEGDEIDQDGMFIKAGDKALCLAFGNSMNNLYVIDILKS